MSKHNRVFEYGGRWITRRHNTDNLYIGWYDGRGRTRHKTLGTSDLETAKDRLIEEVRLNAEMHSERPETVTLRTVLHRYYQNHAIKLASAEQAYYGVIQLDDHFGETPVAEVTPARQREFADRLAERGKSSGYIRRTLATGKAAVNRAIKEGEIQGAPHWDLSIAPEGEPRERVLNLEELAALMRAAQQPHEQMYLIMALATGARPAAILELTVFQLDFDNGLIALNPPGRRQNTKHRPTIPMAPAVRPLLATLPAGPVVSYQGRHLNEITSAFRRIRKAAGFGQDVSAYTLRHTVATELTRRGADIWQTGEFLGHTGGGPKTTRRYVKMSPDHMGSAIRAIQSLINDLDCELGSLDPDHLFNRVRTNGEQAAGGMTV